MKKMAFLAMAIMALMSQSHASLRPELAGPPLTPRLLQAVQVIVESPRSIDFFDCRSCYAFNSQERAHANELMRLLNGPFRGLLQDAYDLKESQISINRLKRSSRYTLYQREQHAKQQHFVHKKTGVVIRHKRYSNQFSVSIYDRFITNQMLDYANGYSSWPFYGWAAQACLGCEVAKVGLVLVGTEVKGNLLPKNPREACATTVSLLTHAGASPFDITANRNWQMINVIMRAGHHSIVTAPDDTVKKPRQGIRAQAASTLTEQNRNARIEGRRRISKKKRYQKQKRGRYVDND